MIYTKTSIKIDPWVAEKIENIPKKSQGMCASRPLKENQFDWFQNAYDQVCRETKGYYINEWWFNITEKRDEFRWHCHDNHCLTAVLYIKLPPRSGGLELKYKHGLWDHIKFFQPAEGDLITFPGTTLHRVRLNFCDDNRISAAFNLIHC